MDNYKWDDSRILLNSSTKACRLVNDSVKTRLAIVCGLLEQILFEIQCSIDFLDLEELRGFS